jgi:type I restriction enzyme S subunit
LGEICDAVGGIIKTGPFGAQLHESDYTDEGIPVVMPKDIIEGRVRVAGIARIGLQDVERLSQHKLEPGDIVYGRRGDIGRQALIGRREAGWLCGTGCLRISLGDKIVDPTFLHYYLRDPRVIRDISNQAVGATMPNLNTKILRGIEVRHPDLPTQRKIAGILSAYDDLIENNLRRIKILEEMAQSLYREWFVHFRFPGHESATFTDSSLGRIPNGWEVRKILDFANVIYGFSFKANRFNTAGEGLPVVRIRNIQDGKSETYTEEEGDPKHRIRNGDILVGMDGDFHMTIWSGGDAWQNQRVAKFRPKGPMGNYFLFLAIEKPIHFFNSTITGTTVAHLGDSHIKTIEFASPPESLMRKASDLLEPLAQEQLNLRRRNQTLRRTRDLLLPKLLSPS